MSSVHIHSSAVIDSDVHISEGARVWHFCHVCSGAWIGRDCVLGQGVYVGPDVEIGDGTKLQNNVSVYAGVTLEAGVFCGPSVVFTNVLNPRATIDRSAEFKSTRVCRGASLGANATILCGIEIGEYALIGAGAVVTSDVPAFGLVVGVPGRLAGWVSHNGHSLDLPASGTGRARCPETGCVYVLEGSTLRQVTEP